MEAESSTARMFLLIECSCPGRSLDLQLVGSRDWLTTMSVSWSRLLDRRRRDDRGQTGVRAIGTARAVGESRGLRRVVAHHGFFRFVIQHEYADPAIFRIERVLLVEVLRRGETDHAQHFRLV